MVKKVALLRLQDICSSDIPFDSNCYFVRNLKQCKGQLSQSYRKHKKFMQINEANK